MSHVDKKKILRNTSGCSDIINYGTEKAFVYLVLYYLLLIGKFFSFVF